MFSKGKKVLIYLCALFAIIMGIITFIPFRTVPFFKGSGNLVNVEVILKVIVFPIIALGLTIFPNILKYKQIKEGKTRSKIVNVMSYFPIATYLLGLLVFTLHTLSYSPEILGNSIWALVILMLIVYVILISVCLSLISSLVIKLDKIGTIALDCSIVVMTICFALVAWKISYSYFDRFGTQSDFFGEGDALLLFAYIISACLLYIGCRSMLKLVRKDEMLLYVDVSKLYVGNEDIRNLEFNRAYNDILTNFEDNFDLYSDEKDLSKEEKEVIAESLETADESPSLEVEARATDANNSEQLEEEKEVVVETLEATDESPSLEEDLLDSVEDNSEKLDEKEEVIEPIIIDEDIIRAEVKEELNSLILEEVNTEQEENMVEIIEEKVEEVQVVEEVLNDTQSTENSILIEKTIKEPKVFVPSYAYVIKYAANFENKEIRVVSNATESVHRFYIGKTLFLVTQKTNSDYRITFLSFREYGAKLLFDNPGAIMRPTSPAGDYWLRLTNKGELSEQLVRDVINNSLLTAEELAEMAKKAKAEKQKQAKVAAKQKEKNAKKNK